MNPNYNILKMALRYEPHLPWYKKHPADQTEIPTPLTRKTSHTPKMALSYAPHPPRTRNILEI